jgi:hypothetical protein
VLFVQNWASLIVKIIDKFLLLLRFINDEWLHWGALLWALLVENWADLAGLIIYNLEWLHDGALLWELFVENWTDLAGLIIQNFLLFLRFVNDELLEGGSLALDEVSLFWERFDYSWANLGGLSTDEFLSVFLIIVIIVFSQGEGISTG